MSYRRLIAGAVLTALLVTGTSVAVAAVTDYVMGTPSRAFTLESSDQIRVDSIDGDPAIVPSEAILREHSSASLDPRSLQCLPNGDLLVASRDGAAVLQFDRTGNVVWSYTLAEFQADFPGETLFQPFSAHRFSAQDGSQHTLVTLRHGEPVFELDENKNVVWQYGDGTASFEPGQVWDAFSATRLPNGNTLIVDNQGCRVIEVRTGDFDADAPSFGFTEDSIVWQYGVAGELALEHGYAEGYLDWPRSAQRLANGNTLISDQVTQRAVEVTPDGHEVWQYGTNGAKGMAPGFLTDPSDAMRLADGTTLISHGKANGEVVRIDSSGELIGKYPGEYSPDDGALIEPRSLDIGPDGTLYIADEGHNRVIGVGVLPDAKATSLQVDCGLPGVTKRFTHLSWSGSGEGAVTLHYSVDGGPWKLGGTAARVNLPTNTTGSYIRYRLVIETSDHQAPVRVEDVAVGYEIVVDDDDDDGDGGDGDGDGDTDGGGGEGDGSSGGGSASNNTTDPKKSTPKIVAQGPKAASSPTSGSGGPTESAMDVGLGSAPGLVSGWVMDAAVGASGHGGSAHLPLRTGGLAFLGGLWLLGAMQYVAEPYVKLPARLARLIYSTRS